MKIGVVATGQNNLNAVLNILIGLGAEGVIADSPEDFEGIDGIVMPGVGSYDAAIKVLNSKHTFDAVKQWLEADKPVLAICLGFQLLFDGSEEGELPGFSLIPGVCSKFQPGLEVPRMGWSFVDWVADHDIGKGGKDDSGERYYLVHSYHAPRNEYEIGLSFYGDDYCVAVKKGNVIGTQFHPEKSLKYGIEIFKYFLEVVETHEA